MNRRNFLSLSAAAFVQPQSAPKKAETAVARASMDTTPRVGLVLSDFKGAEDHDGTKIPGLSDPQPQTTDLTDVQFEAMVRQAIEIGGKRRGNLSSAVGVEDWVLVKPGLASSGAPRESGADPRIARYVIEYLAERKRGLRFTILGNSYREMATALGRKYGSIQFEALDPETVERAELPVSGKISARSNKSGTYRIPKIVQECDRLITIAPLRTHPLTGVSLGIGNYWDFAPAEHLLEVGAPEEVLIDLFSYHPADYTVLGGSWGVEGDGPADLRAVHHNLIIAGANAAAVDAVGAAVMGFDPVKIPYLVLADKRGYGGYETELIWTRGNDIEQARRAFRKPARWIG
jgi:uncharacterized protein (DUF362 family)